MDEQKTTKAACAPKAPTTVADVRAELGDRTTCPYCGMKLDTPREVLVHVFNFHYT